jgi:hypothetical protein
VRAAVVGTCLILALGCGRRALPDKSSAPQLDASMAADSAPVAAGDARGAGTDAPGAGGDVVTTGSDAAAAADGRGGDLTSGCGTRPSGMALDSLAGLATCPPTLADIASRCSYADVHRTTCRDYVDVDIAPAGADQIGNQFNLKCFYSPDSMALFGESLFPAASIEDPFAFTAGDIPVYCTTEPCSAPEPVCPSPGDAGSGPDSSR